MAVPDRVIKEDQNERERGGGVEIQTGAISSHFRGRFIFAANYDKFRGFLKA
jgi:hypothetical protein